MQLIVRAGLDVLSSRICEPLWTEIYHTLEASFLLEGHRLQRLEIQAHSSVLATPTEIGDCCVTEEKAIVLKRPVHYTLRYPIAVVRHG